MRPEVETSSPFVLQVGSDADRVFASTPSMSPLQPGARAGALRGDGQPCGCVPSVSLVLRVCRCDSTDSPAQSQSPQAEVELDRASHFSAKERNLPIGVKSPANNAAA